MYEGLVAAEQAKYKMYGDIAKITGGTLGNLLIGYGQMKGYRKMQREIDTSYPYPGFQKTTGQPGEVIEGQPGEVVEGDPVDTSADGKTVTVNIGGTPTEVPFEDRFKYSAVPGQNKLEGDQGGLLEGQLNAQEDMIVKDGKWVEYTPASDAAGQYSQGAWSALNSHLENGGSYSDMQWNLVQDHFEFLKAEMEKADKGLFPKKKKRNKLKREAEAWRAMTNQRAANTKAISSLYKSGDVDLKASFQDMESRNGDKHLGPDLDILAAQIFDPTATKSDQFELFVENGQVMIRYAQGRMGIQYNKGKGIQGKKIPKSEWKTISETELFSQIQTKDKDTPLAANDIMTISMGRATATIGETDNLELDSYGDIRELEYEKYLETFKDPKANLTYIAENPHKLGDSMINFSEDYLQNYKLDEAIVNTYGIGSDIISMADLTGPDGKPDGFINQLDTDFAKSKGQEELSKHEAAKTAFMKRLTNPQTKEKRWGYQLEEKN